MHGKFSGGTSGSIIAGINGGGAGELQAAPLRACRDNASTFLSDSGRALRGTKPIVKMVEPFSLIHSDG